MPSSRKVSRKPRRKRTTTKRRGEADVAPYRLGPSDAELDAIEREQEDVDADLAGLLGAPVPVETVDQYLDRLNLERLEIERLENDLFPGVPPAGAKYKKTRSADEPIQKWLADDRSW